MRYASGDSVHRKRKMREGETSGSMGQHQLRMRQAPLQSLPSSNKTDQGVGDVKDSVRMENTDEWSDSCANLNMAMSFWDAATILKCPIHPHQDAITFSLAPSIKGSFTYSKIHIITIQLLMATVTFKEDPQNSR